jgi:hypothetical protein
MRRKLGKTEVLALLAAAGVSTCAAAQAAKVENSAKTGVQSLQAIEQPSRTQLGGKEKEMACGKGACGTDESGAKAAADKHTKAVKSDKKAAAKKATAGKEAIGDKKNEPKKDAGK